LQRIHRWRKTMWHGTSNSLHTSVWNLLTASKPMNAPASQIESGLENQSERSESNSTTSRTTRARIVSVVTVIVGILLAATGSCARHESLLGTPPMPLWQIIPSMLSVSFLSSPHSRVASYERPAANCVSTFRNLAGVLSFTFFASVVCWSFAFPDALGFAR